MKAREFNDILDRCLERIIQGETVEQCLASYPEYAAELEPLLRTALVTKKAVAIEPRPEFKAKARYQFRAAIAGLEAKKSRRFFGWQPRWATAVVTIIILLLAGSGTVVAAGNSTPDQPLYTVKLATETVWLQLTPSQLAKAELYAKLADRRVKEIVVMASREKPKEVERTVERLNEHLERLASLSGQRGPALAEVQKGASPSAPHRVTGIGGEGDTDEKRALLKKILTRRATDNPEVLRALWKKAPPSVEPALRRAIEVADNGYKHALEKLD